MTHTFNKKIWIDLDNSPHVLFFSPIIRELRIKGIQVIIIARNFTQILDLLRLYNIQANIIGKHYGKNIIFKTIEILIRAMQLLPTIIKNKPDFTISHGSRAQFLASKISGIKIGIALDYEYIKMFPFLKADIVFAPILIEENKIKFEKRNHQHNCINYDYKVLSQFVNKICDIL